MDVCVDDQTDGMHKRLNDEHRSPESKMTNNQVTAHACAVAIDGSNQNNKKK